MSVIDKVVTTATDLLGQGKDMAQTQQLKFQLKRLQDDEHAAQAALGANAHAAIKAGTIEASGELDGLIQRVDEAKAAVEAKKAEIAAVRNGHGADEDVVDVLEVEPEPEAPAPEV